MDKKPTGSYATFSLTALNLMLRLEETIRFKQRVPHAIDRQGEIRAKELIIEIQVTMDRMAESRERVNQDRKWLPIRLLELQREAEELIVATRRTMPPPVDKIR